MGTAGDCNRAHKDSRPGATCATEYLRLDVRAGGANERDLRVLLGPPALHPVIEFPALKLQRVLHGSYDEALLS
jgi:hypothetical protein